MERGSNNCSRNINQSVNPKSKKESSLTIKDLLKEKQFNAVLKGMEKATLEGFKVV
jgi:hypothetical protein